MRTHPFVCDCMAQYKEKSKTGKELSLFSLLSIEMLCSKKLFL